MGGNRVMGKVYELRASERRAGVIDDRMCRGGRGLRASFLGGAKKMSIGPHSPLHYVADHAGPSLELESPRSTGLRPKGKRL